MKQHYIPRCYLDEFTGPDGKMATLDYDLIKKGRNAKILFKSPAQLGYESHIYTLNIPLPEPYHRLQKEKPLLIEQDLFRDYENHYPKILEQIRNRKSLTRQQAELFITTLVSLKLRNKYILNPEKYRSTLSNVFTRDKEKIIEQSRELYPEMSREEKLAIFATVEAKALANDDFIKGASLMALIQRETDGEGPLFKIASKLFNCRWTILEATGGTSFTTTDNPGFCIDSNNLPYNMNFADATFFFPLTPDLCLVINDKIRDQRLHANRSSKPVYYTKADDNAIKPINECSTLFCNSYAIAQSRETLETLSRLSGK